MKVENLMASSNRHSVVEVSSTMRTGTIIPGEVPKRADGSLD
jgi:hypothetical protein